MFRLSKMTDYSTVIMSYMAREPGDINSVAAMAMTLDIAAPTVSKILKILAQRGLVRATRGAKGGYRLSRMPEQISIAEIIDAMEGPFGVTECNVATGLCTKEAGCSIRGNWQRINQVIRHTLDQVTLADMNQTPVAPVYGRSRAPSDKKEVINGNPGIQA